MRTKVLAAYALRKALYTRLNDTTFASAITWGSDSSTSAVGVWNNPPDDADYPFISIAESDGEQGPLTTSGQEQSIIWSIHIFSEQSDTAEIERIVSLIHTEIVTGTPLSLEGNLDISTGAKLDGIATTLFPLDGGENGNQNIMRIEWGIWDDTPPQ